MKHLLKALCFCICLVSAGSALADAGGVRWMDYAEGTALARSQGKTAMVYFHAAWCPSCKKMEAETFPRPEVVEMVNETFVAIRVDTDQHQEIARAYGVTGVPELWLIRPDATPIGSVPGFVPAQRLVKILEYQRR